MKKKHWQRRVARRLVEVFQPIADAELIGPMAQIGVVKIELHDEHDRDIGDVAIRLAMTSGKGRGPASVASAASVMVRVPIGAGAY